MSIYGRRARRLGIRVSESGLSELCKPLESERLACQYCQLRPFDNSLDSEASGTLKMSIPKISNVANSALGLSSSALRRIRRLLRRLMSFGNKSGEPVRAFVALASQRLIQAAAFFAFASLCAGAQAPQLLPEIDTYLKINPLMRAYFQAEGDRDGGVPIQATIGPSLQFYLKPLLTLKRVTTFDLDDAKKRPLVLEAGYRVITAPNEPVENRFMPIVTAALPTKGLLLITDRNRADLDWKAGVFSWRYRNRLTVQRTFSIGSYHVSPYLNAEVYYTSQYSKWSTTQLEAGGIFPIGRHVQMDAYYEHQNNTGKKPNEQVNDIGVAAHIFFPLRDSRTTESNPKAPAR